MVCGDLGGGERPLEEQPTPPAPALGSRRWRREAPPYLGPGHNAPALPWSENLAQTVVVEFLQQFGHLTLSFQPAQESVKKLGRHHHKHLFTPFLGPTW